LVGTCFRGNDFATIKIFDQKSLTDFLVGSSFLGNDFATIKNFRPKIIDQNPWKEPVFEKMILQP
jgi:hypothetical protein